MVEFPKATNKKWIIGTVVPQGSILSSMYLICLNEIYNLTIVIPHNELKQAHHSLVEDINGFTTED